MTDWEDVGTALAAAMVLGSLAATWASTICMLRVVRRVAADVSKSHETQELVEEKFRKLFARLESGHDHLQVTAKSLERRTRALESARVKAVAGSVAVDVVAPAYARESMPTLAPLQPEARVFWEGPKADESGDDPGDEPAPASISIDVVLSRWNEEYGATRLDREQRELLLEETGWTVAEFPHQSDLVLLWEGGLPVRGGLFLLPRLNAMVVYLRERYFDVVPVDSGVRAVVKRVVRPARLAELDDRQITDLLSGAGQFKDSRDLIGAVRLKGEVEAEAKPLNQTRT